MKYLRLLWVNNKTLCLNGMQDVGLAPSAAGVISAARAATGAAVATLRTGIPDIVPIIMPVICEQVSAVNGTVRQQIAR